MVVEVDDVVVILNTIIKLKYANVKQLFK